MTALAGRHARSRNARAAYVELVQGRRSARTVKQHLACIRMLFGWLVIGR